MEKITQIIQLIISARGRVTKTGLLKLLFIVDEYSITHTGRPITDLDYKIWQFGPVSEQLLNAIDTNSLELHEGYILYKRDNETYFNTENNPEPSKDLLSKNEDTLISYALNEVSGIKDGDLVKYLHSEGSLWRVQASKLGVLEALESNSTTKTDHSIDFKVLIEGNPRLIANFERHQENVLFFS